MVIRRGEVWWAELAAPAGSEPGYRRPVLVLQATDINRSAIQTVACVAFTSNLAAADAPGNLLVRKDESGLPKDAVVNVSHFVAVDKSLFRSRAGALSPARLREIELGGKVGLDFE